eukprot:3759077-Rhodomonas_salina.2
MANGGSVRAERRAGCFRSVEEERCAGATDAEDREEAAGPDQTRRAGLGRLVGRQGRSSELRVKGQGMKE